MTACHTCDGKSWGRDPLRPGSVCWHTQCADYHEGKRYGYLLRRCTLGADKHWPRCEEAIPIMGRLSRSWLGW